MKNSNRQLLSKILIGFVTIVLVLVLSIGTAMIWSTKSIIKHSYMEKSTLIAEKLLDNINVEKYEQLAKNPEEGELYFELQEHLTQLLKVSPITYIYVAVPPKSGDEEGMTLVDGGDLKSDEVYHFGETIDGVYYNDILIKLKEDGSFSEYDQSGDYGDIISSYVPIKNADGEIFAILGVDDELGTIGNLQKAALQDVMPIFIVIIITVSIAIMATLGFYLYRLLLPIGFLRNSIFKLEEGDLIESQRIIEAANLKKDTSIILLGRVYRTTLQSLAAMVRNIHRTSDEVKETTANVSTVTSTIDASTNDLLYSINEISKSVKQQDTLSSEMLEAMELMVANISEVTEQVQQVTVNLKRTSHFIYESANQADHVSLEVQATSDTVKETAQNVQYLTQRYSDIESMVSIIQSIADQTNLLALNASIEAARAGEHGKGFAVVADEVKNLAELTKQSTEEIGRHIQQFKTITQTVLVEMNTNTEKVAAGASQVKSISDLLVKVSNETGKVLHDVELVEGITQKMVNTARNVSEAISQTTNVSRQVVESTAVVQKAANAQEDTVIKLKVATQQLSANVEVFEEILKKYKA